MKTLEKPTPEGIRTYKKSLELYYGELKRQRETDQKFYDDDFDVKIKEPYRTVRTGAAAKMVDSISDYINTSRIIVTREPKKTTALAKESAEKVSSLLMNYVDKFKEAIIESSKNAPLRGEAVFQTQYIEDDLPLNLSSPDPMIILCDPQESHDGVPIKVVKTCKMTVGAVQAMYPKWESSKDSTKLVEYIAYWDKDWRYVEADRMPCIDIQKNILGFVPFVHCASGLGKDSPDGKPETKYVGKLKKFRGLLTLQCETHSRYDSGLALWANPYGIFEIIDKDVKFEEGEGPDKIDLSPGHNITVPFGVKFTVNGGTPPPRDVLVYLGKIDGMLEMETPPVISGVPSTADASGRQEDIYTAAFRKKPEQIEKKLERALATALGQALRILDTIPGLLPLTVVSLEYKDGSYGQKEEKITKEDIDGYYGCKVEFKADEELEQGRKLMLYRSLYEMPSGPRISWKTLLVKGLGMTEEEANDEIVEATVDRVMHDNPMMDNITAEEAMKKLGMETYLAKAQQEGMPLVGGMQPPGSPRTFTGQPGNERQTFNQEAGGQVRRPPMTGGQYGG